MEHIVFLLYKEMITGGMLQSLYVVILFRPLRD